MDLKNLTIDRKLDLLTSEIKVHINSWDGEIVTYNLRMSHNGETTFFYETDSEHSVNSGSNYGSRLLSAREKKFEDALDKMINLIGQYGINTSRFEFILHTDNNAIEFYKGYDREAFMNDVKENPKKYLE